ncbi:MAG TPA: ribosomal-processing cysteine protease Prp [Bacilli bacterium]|nr:ribosomal-processing cysteine protease Prp [Bacilli bacterium]
MIKIKVKEENNYIEQIKISGHALYDDYGKDIVCSSVSSMVILTINLLIKLDNESINYDNIKGIVTINVLKTDELINIILYNLVDMLKELSEEYDKYIKFI